MFVPALLGKKKEQKMTNLLYVVPSAMILLHELGKLRIYLEKSDPALFIEFQANDAYFLISWMTTVIFSSFLLTIHLFMASA